MARYLQREMCMKKILRLFAVMSAILLSFSAGALEKGDGYDVFVPIGKYIAQGDVDCLSAWFAGNLEVSILSNQNNSSRNQAKQILKAFYEQYPPRQFTISHQCSRATMKNAVGELYAGGEKFMVTIFVIFNKKANSYKIQQLKIERIQ